MSSPRHNRRPAAGGDGVRTGNGAGHPPEEDDPRHLRQASGDHRFQRLAATYDLSFGIEDEVAEGHLVYEKDGSPDRHRVRVRRSTRRVRNWTTANSAAQGGLVIRNPNTPDLLRESTSS
ncbi:MAG: hypothetical protein R2789_00850 [Microthrixaceae bacterium]